MTTHSKPEGDVIARKRPRPQPDFLLKVGKDRILISARRSVLRWILLLVLLMIFLALILVARSNPGMLTLALDAILRLTEILLTSVLAKAIRRL